MLVKVLSFGTNWWARLGREADGEHRFTRNAAYYNSTGIRCGGKVRRHWIVPGLIRFNGVGNFNPRVPHRGIGRTFLCSDVDFLFGGNRLLMKKRMPKDTMPDWYLVVISRELHGPIDFGAHNWKSSQSQVIAASRLRETEETMLLMKPGDWVRSGWGFWQLCAAPAPDSGATLELEEEPLAA